MFNEYCSGESDLAPQIKFRRQKHSSSYFKMWKVCKCLNQTNGILVFHFSNSSYNRKAWQWFWYCDVWFCQIGLFWQFVDTISVWIENCVPYHAQCEVKTHFWSERHNYDINCGVVSILFLLLVLLTHKRECWSTFIGLVHAVFYLQYNTIQIFIMSLFRSPCPKPTTVGCIVFFEKPGF
jgi:hypothetical protein